MSIGLNVVVAERIKGAWNLSGIRAGLGVVGMSAPGHRLWICQFGLFKRGQGMCLATWVQRE